MEAYSRNEKVKPEMQRRNIMLFGQYVYICMYSVIYLLKFAMSAIFP